MVVTNRQSKVWKKCHRFDLYKLFPNDSLDALLKYRFGCTFFFFWAKNQRQGGHGFLRLLAGVQ
jgi:hypothetical protein